MTQIFNAKTVEDAKELAARTFGVPEEEIQFEILEEPKKGLFGLVKKGEAKIKATYISKNTESDVTSFQEVSVQSPASVQDFTEEVSASDAMSESAISDESESAISVESESAIPDESESAISIESESAISVGSESAISVESESAIPVENDSAIPVESESAIPVESESAIPVESESAISVESESAIPVESESAISVSEEKKSSLQSDTELITGEPSASALDKIEKAKSYLLDVLSAMGIQAELEVNAGSESAIIDIITPNSGAIIGKRGETLDSLQYLTFMTANRADKEYYRIILNTANYRERRRKTLEELAAKIAKNVLHSHRSTTLEPMNPYERRIIHSTIAQIDGVNSKSIGEEPYRKVVISSNDKPLKSNKRRNYHDKDKSDKNRRNYHGRRDGSKRTSDTPPTRISMDSMKTSFERDYKRPKPEDDINAGLYGKIEI